jgi:tetratricopeptide (TPR) repeat protein
MADNRQIMEEAAVLRKQDRHDEAILLFEPVWSENRETMTKWDCWNYGLCLKRVGQIEQALEVCQYTHSLDASFRYNNNLYAWCIYETEIKGKRPSDVAHDEVRFTSSVHKIVQLTEQDQFSPYEIAVMVFLRYLNSKQNVPFSLIIEWTDKLDPTQLNDACLAYEDDDGKQRELASFKETWYAYRTKALEKLGQYEECLTLSREALDTFSEFHYGNDIWFRWRIGKSLYSLGHLSEAISEIETVLKFKKEWYVHDLLSQAHFDSGDFDLSLKYAAEAALNHGEHKNKYKLFLRMGDLFEIKGNLELACRHVELAALAHSEQPTDRIPNALQDALTRFSLSEPSQTSFTKLYNSLRPTWQKIRLSDLPQATGFVSNLLPNGKAGFIQSDDGTSHYFKVKSFQGNRTALRTRLRVSFFVKPSFDPKKQRESTEAVQVVAVDNV